MNIRLENKFDKLSNLLEYLKIEYPQTNIKGINIDYDSGAQQYGEMPRFLFRGEHGLYPRSQTSMGRMITDPDDTLSLADRSTLKLISLFVDKLLRTRLKDSGMFSSGYVQHYGLYSELLDFTSDLTICARFATEKHSIGKPGRICVLDVQQAIKHGTLFDLRHHSFGTRPRNQHAFGVFSKDYGDFKDELCIRDMGLIWYEFEINDNPKGIVDLDIYDVYNDQLAGYTALLIDECIVEHGNLSPEAAHILSKRVTRVPLFILTRDVEYINFGALGQGRSAREIGLDKCAFSGATINDLKCMIDVSYEMNYSRSKWSGDNVNALKPFNYITNTPDKSTFTIRITNSKMINISLEE